MKSGNTNRYKDTAAPWEELLRDEFIKESERACVIVAVALLDSALECLLKARLVPAASGDDTFIDGAYAPLSTFNARIDACFRFGLISSQFSRDLHLIRRIRNDFAHNITGCTFENASVRNRVLELSRSHNILQGQEKWIDYYRNSIKGNFELAVSWMQWHLRGLISHANCITVADQEFGYTWLENTGKETKDNL